MSVRDDIYAALGRQIRARRKELGLTQAELAGLCGKDGNGWVSSVESGAKHLTARQLTTLASALHIPVAALFASVDATPASSNFQDVGLGGKSHPVIPLLRERLWLPQEALLTVWPSMLANPGELPMADGICVATKATRRPEGQAAWLVHEEPQDASSKLVYLPRPQSWRHVSPGYEVLMILKA